MFALSRKHASAELLIIKGVVILKNVIDSGLRCFFFGLVVVVLMDKLKFHILFGGNGFYGKHELKLNAEFEIELELWN